MKWRTAERSVRRERVLIGMPAFGQYRRCFAYAAFSLLFRTGFAFANQPLLRGRAVIRRQLPRPPCKERSVISVVSGFSSVSRYGGLFWIGQC